MPPTRTLERRRRLAGRRWRALHAAKEPVVYVGLGSCGLAAGAGEVLHAVRDHLGDRGVEARVVTVGCIGPCYLEPLLDVQLPGRPRLSYANMSPELVVKTLDALLAGETPKSHLLGSLDGDVGGNGDGPSGDGDGRSATVARFFDHPMLAPQTRLVLRDCGIIDPEAVDHYLARDGYLAFERCLSLSPDDVIDLVRVAGLRGRGGAGFPTWRKWRDCRDADGARRFLICNADEGDPGAFMNRSLIEGDPHAVLEGMLIAAYAIGAEQGFIYVRAEYPLAIRRLRDGDRGACGASACWARTSSGAASHSISPSKKAPAPSSAARRPR